MQGEYTIEISVCKKGGEKSEGDGKSTEFREEADGGAIEEKALWRYLKSDRRGQG